MAITAIQRAYESWLKKNARRFRYPPFIAVSRSDYFVLKFTGIAAEISCRIGKNGSAEVLVRDAKGVYWDIIADFDVSLRRDPGRGYYCGLCLRKRYFRSMQALWKREIFRELLHWTNENFRPDRWICLWRIPRRAWGARFIDEKDIENRSSDCLKIFPVVVRDTEMEMAGLKE